MDDASEDPSELGFFLNKRTDRTYITKVFDLDKWNPDQSEPVRMVSKVFDIDERHEFAQIKGETVLYVTTGVRQEVKAVFYEDNRGILRLTIQRFSAGPKGRPHKQSFTFGGEGLQKLYKMLVLIRYADFKSTDKARMDDHALDDWLVTEEEWARYLRSRPDLVATIAGQDITERDIVAFGYRKKQLQIFEGLLNDEDFFKAKAKEWEVNGKEAVWQKFFEDNPWIFGYGLNFVFTSRLDDKKLEQVTTGFSVTGAGKRTDALMKTRGYISSLCFVEIKTHHTSLLRKEQYRSESWSISDELAGSVAQVQKTIQKALRDIQTKTSLTDEGGNPTNEVVFFYQPKAYVVIGCLDQFLTPNGVNESRFSSFELFRRNVVNPEIITFDELYERAKFIVQHSETEKPFKQPEGEVWLNESEAVSGADLPF